MIRLKRAYDAAEPADGTRILVDRLWPRGLARSTAHIARWAKEIAPSDTLRKWYGHRPERYEEFRSRYRAELDERGDLVRELRSEARENSLTLVFASRDAEHSNAKVLKEYLERRR